MTKLCAYPGCDRPRPESGTQLCWMHYARKRRGKPMEPKHITLRPRPTCSVSGCDRLAKMRGMCRGHYDRALRGASVKGPIRPFLTPEQKKRIVALYRKMTLMEVADEIGCHFTTVGLVLREAGVKRRKPGGRP